jgi:hypothetical protein
MLHVPQNLLAYVHAHTIEKEVQLLLMRILNISFRQLRACESIVLSHAHAARQCLRGTAASCSASQSKQYYGSPRIHKDVCMCMCVCVFQEKAPVHSAKANVPDIHVHIPHVDHCVPTKHCFQEKRM